MCKGIRKGILWSRRHHGRRGTVVPYQRLCGAQQPLQPGLFRLEGGIGFLEFDVLALQILQFLFPPLPFLPRKNGIHDFALVGILGDRRGGRLGGMG